MNDFTLEELKTLKACVNTTAYKSLRQPFDLEPELCFLRNKIQLMIDNYEAVTCQHETDQGGCGGDGKYLCKKCGKLYHA